MADVEFVTDNLRYTKKQHNYNRRCAADTRNDAVRRYGYVNEHRK